MPFFRLLSSGYFLLFGRKINKLGTTVLLATHNDDIVNALKKRVVTLNQGKVVSDQEAGTYKL